MTKLPYVCTANIAPYTGYVSTRNVVLNVHKMTHTPGKESVLQVRNDLKSKQLSTFKFLKYSIINTVDPYHPQISKFTKVIPLITGSPLGDILDTETKI